MTDTTQGADALDDNALFNEATSLDTLDKFENPTLPEPKAPEPKPAEPAKAPEAKGPDGKTAPEPKPEDNAPVPAGRLREESEARRRAERERDDLQRRLEALTRQPVPQQPQQPLTQKEIDLFDNPKGFVKQEVQPMLEQLQGMFQQQREAMSLDYAVRNHGDETVGAARQHLEQGMQRNDPNAWATYRNAMQSHDPYGVIVKSYRERETLRNIGGDLEAYKKRVIDEAMSDPEFQKRFLETVKGQAGANGNNVARPVRPQVSSSPSLGNVGAAGGDQQLSEPSDIDLFRAATTSKRR